MSENSRLEDASVLQALTAAHVSKLTETITVFEKSLELDRKSPTDTIDTLIGYARANDQRRGESRHFESALAAYLRAQAMRVMVDRLTAIELTPPSATS